MQFKTTNSTLSQSAKPFVGGQHRPVVSVVVSPADSSTKHSAASSALWAAFTSCEVPAVSISPRPTDPRTAMTHPPEIHRHLGCFIFYLHSNVKAELI